MSKRIRSTPASSPLQKTRSVRPTQPAAARSAERPAAEARRGWKPKAGQGHHGKAAAHGKGHHGHSTTETALHHAEQTGHTAKAVGSLAEAAGKFERLAKGTLLGPLALPFATLQAQRDARKATRSRSAQDRNRAVGSMAFATSIGLETTKVGIELAQHRAAKRASVARTAKLAAQGTGRFGARLVPALSYGVAVADAVWARSVFKDKKASAAKKTAAGVSAGASAVAAVASTVPFLGTGVAAVASGVSTGALLLSGFL